MPKKSHVQLNLSELKRVRSSIAKADKELQLLADITFTKLGLKPLPLGPNGISKVIIKPSNTKRIFYGKNGKCAAVYEDPPGICRPCNDPDSTDGHLE